MSEVGRDRRTMKFTAINFDVQQISRPGFEDLSFHFAATTSICYNFYQRRTKKSRMLTMSAARLRLMPLCASSHLISPIKSCINQLEMSLPERGTRDMNKQRRCEKNLIKIKLMNFYLQFATSYSTEDEMRRR